MITFIEVFWGKSLVAYLKSPEGAYKYGANQIAYFRKDISAGLRGGSTSSLSRTFVSLCCTHVILLSIEPRLNSKQPPPLLNYRFLVTDKRPTFFFHEIREPQFEHIKYNFCGLGGGVELIQPTYYLLHIFHVLRAWPRIT